MESRHLRRLPYARQAAVLLLYTALAVALTWPLAARFGSHVPGDGIDDPALAWNLWWIKARLVEQTQLDLFHVDWLFHPLGINFAFYTLTPLNGLLSIPLQAVLPLPAASNTVLLSSYVLGGYGAYLLARRVLGRVGALNSATGGAAGEAAALLAGVVYAFASSKLFYAALGQFNIAGSQWIPFCVLFLLNVQPNAGRRGLRAAFLAGLFLVFQAWTELTYASFLLIFIALYFVWQTAVALAAPRRGAAFAGLAGQGLALAAVALAGLAPFLAAMLPDLRAEGDFFASGGGFADIFSADLAGFLLPTRLHPLVGGWAAALPFPNDKGQQIYVGYAALALAALGGWALLRGKRSARAHGWFWTAAALLFWLLALGPHPRWLGQDLPLWGPFALVSRLPFFSGNRYPSRYSVVLMLCVAVLAAVGAAALLRRVRPGRVRLVAALLAALFLLEHLSTPLPLSDLRIPSLYAELAAQPGDFALLELPTGWRNGARVLGRSDLLIMRQQWYQTAHGKRRLGGNTSRNPEYKFQYFTQAPLLGDLIALMNADRDHMRPVIAEQYPALAERGRALAPRVLDFLGAPYVVVHVAQATPELLRDVEDALPLELVQEWPGSPGGEGPMHLYRVTESGPAAWEVELSSAEGALHLAEGWAPQGADGIRYATRPTPVLLLDLPAEGGMLTLDLYGPAIEVTLRLNGREIAQTEPARAQVVVPPGVAAAPVDRLELLFQGAPLSPGALGSPPEAGRPVGDTGATLPAGVALLARSAGEEVGSFAHLYLDGLELTQPARGYHLAAVQPDGALLGVGVFDTFAAESEAAALASWLARWPEGTIVAGAAADEVSLRLTGEAVDALRRLGVAGDLRGRFRWSHAFVGAVGAAPGAAVEEFGLLQPATAAVGAPVDGPAVYGGVGRAAFIPAAR